MVSASPTTSATPPVGTHSVRFDGDKATVFNVELFCGYDAAIDGDDESMKRYGPAKLDEIVARTRQFVDRGQIPQLVVLHDRPGEPAAEECVGRAMNLRIEQRGETKYIVGDLECSRDFFDAQIRTNRLPRRSAEIWDDGYMSEIALLGRDTPRRPLPDTHYGRDGKTGGKRRFTRDIGHETQFGESGPGAGNVYIPSAGTPRKEDDDMSDIDWKTRCEKAETELAALRSKHERDGDKETHAREIASLRGERDQMARDLADLKAQGARDKFARDVEALVRDGYAIPEKHRAALVDELVASDKPDDKLARWRETFARKPVGVVLPSGASRFEPASDASSIDVKKASEEAVRLSASDPSKTYAEHFARLTGKTTHAGK